MTASNRLSRDEIRRKLTSFKAHWLRELEDWKAEGLTGEEQKAAQRFWIDLFECFGVSAARMNLFERNARRASTGNTGRIDLFYPSVVIGEAKKPGVNLDVAYHQVLDYLNGGTVSEFEMPKFILCANFEYFRIIRLGNEDVAFDISFPLAEIVDHLDELKFLAGYDVVTKAEEKKASVQASKLMAELFTAMAGDDVDEPTGDEAPTNYYDEERRVHETSMYLTRLLFLLFGDDAGLWEADLFTRFVEENTTPDNLGPQLNALFEVLNTPENQRRNIPDSLAAFPYVNGAIFSESMRTQYFNEDMYEALKRACRFNWAEISPAIFGSLFQLVKSKEARRSDGEHYTSETNILKTIDPLFLAEIRAEANRLISSKTVGVKKLREFRDSLADHVFLDPACGSGNFLIVAYRELRKIETDLIVAIRAAEGKLEDMALDVTFEQKLNIGQFYGIELNWWPAQIAETAMFLVDHQANKELAERIGAAPDRLPIAVTAHVYHENALLVDWNNLVPKVKGKTFVFGNPPFVGARLMDGRRKTEIQKVWTNQKGVNQLDYVTGWFVQATRFLESRSGKFAFVATNSISQGEQAALLGLFLDKCGWKAFFAHRTFRWDSEAPGKAAVHCVIIGYSRELKRGRIWDYSEVNGSAVELSVENSINFYLVDGPRIAVLSATQPISKEIVPVHFGSMPNDGNLLVPKAGTPLPENDPIAMKYVRKFVGARELVHGIDRWCYWMPAGILQPSDLDDSTELKAAVQGVKELRSSSKRAETRELARTPYQFGEIRQPDTDYLAIPRHVGEMRKYFTAQPFDFRVICGDANFQVEDPDGYLFALISSSMFMVWQRTVGGKIKSDLRFSKRLTWNTFPVPELTESQRKKIIVAGQKVLDARALYPERSLADHYKPLTMDPTLVKAHDILDREVDMAFGALKRLRSEKQRLEILFKNYQALTK